MCVCVCVCVCDQVVLIVWSSLTHSLSVSLSFPTLSIPLSNTQSFYIIHHSWKSCLD